MALPAIQVPLGLLDAHPHLAIVAAICPPFTWGAYRLLRKALDLGYGLLMAILLADHPEHIADAIAAGLRFNRRGHPPPKRR